MRFLNSPSSPRVVREISPAIRATPLGIGRGDDDAGGSAPPTPHLSRSPRYRSRRVLRPPTKRFPAALSINCGDDTDSKKPVTFSPLASSSPRVQRSAESGLGHLTPQKPLRLMSFRWKPLAPSGDKEVSLLVQGNATDNAPKMPTTPTSPPRRATFRRMPTMYKRHRDRAMRVTTPKESRLLPPGLVSPKKALPGDTPGLGNTSWTMERAMFEMQRQVRYRQEQHKDATLAFDKLCRAEGIQIPPQYLESIPWPRDTQTRLMSDPVGTKRGLVLSRFMAPIILGHGHKELLQPKARAQDLWMSRVCQEHCLPSVQQLINLQSARTTSDLLQQLPRSSPRVLETALFLVATEAARSLSEQEREHRLIIRSTMRLIRASLARRKVAQEEKPDGTIAASEDAPRANAESETDVACATNLASKEKHDPESSSETPLDQSQTKSLSSERRCKRRSPTQTRARCRSRNRRMRLVSMDPRPVAPRIAVQRAPLPLASLSVIFDQPGNTEPQKREPRSLFSAFTNITTAKHL